MGKKVDRLGKITNAQILFREPESLGLLPGSRKI